MRISFSIYKNSKPGEAMLNRSRWGRGRGGMNSLSMAGLVEESLVESLQTRPSSTYLTWGGRQSNFQHPHGVSQPM